jgi:hypothetical protein
MRNTDANLRLMAAAALGMAFAGSAQAQLVEPDAVILDVLRGTENGDNFGWVVATVGDLDGDRVDELLIPAIAANQSAGRVTLYSGATRAPLFSLDGQPGQLLGYSLSPAGDVNADGVEDYAIGGGAPQVRSGRDHSLLLDLSGLARSASALAAVGDVDDDGHDDFLLGAQKFVHGENVDAGRALLVSGCDGHVIWERIGPYASAFYGSATGGLADINGDGRKDAVIGSFGGPSGPGFADVVDGRTGSLIRTLTPPNPRDERVFAQFFASDAGDVDGDRMSDIFIADYAAAKGGLEGVGRAYVFSGRTGRVLHALSGNVANDGFGPGRGVPDVNGDGHADLIIAAYTNSDGAPQAGKTLLFSGRSGALLRTFTANVANDNFGVDALPIGDVNDDNLPDFLVTSVGLSFAGTAPGSATIIAGNVLPCPADLDGSGRVDGKDLRLLRQAIASSRADFDLNGDGVTDARDLEVLRKDVGRCPSGRPRRS